MEIGGLARRRRSLPPGFEGRRQLIPDTVESPYVKGDFESVIRNVGESSLIAMFYAQKIDAAQLRSGEWFRATYERTRMGSMAIDPSKEPVDTSGHSDPIPDRVIIAAEQLALARKELSPVGYMVVELVCGQGWTIEEATRGEASRSVWRVFRLALNKLAEWRGYATKKV